MLRKTARSHRARNHAVCTLTRMSIVRFRRWCEPQAGGTGCDNRESMEAMYGSDFSRRLVADAEHFVGAIATFIVDEREIKTPAA